MKTAISIPDDVFAEAERLARRLKKSRSELYSRAIREYIAREYIARHGSEHVTETLDRLFAETPSEKASLQRQRGERLGVGHGDCSR
jgi:metal-responsive CopG/Arc/MetJ family transcriptional regulator